MLFFDYIILFPKVLLGNYLRMHILVTKRKGLNPNFYTQYEKEVRKNKDKAVRVLN
jgi:hypothetical protein